MRQRGEYLCLIKNYMKFHVNCLDLDVSLYTYWASEGVATLEAELSIRIHEVQSTPGVYIGTCGR